MAHLEDKRRVQSLLDGNERDFEAFFDEYYPKVYRFCARRLAEPDLEEVVMSTLRQTFRRMETYRGEASLFTWICQIARSELSAYYEKHARRPRLVPLEDQEGLRAELESIPAASSDEPDSVLEGDQRRQLVQVLLDYLPGQYGQVLEAKYIEGLSMNEIAERLQTTSKAVESMLVRARAAFKQQFASLNKEMSDVVVPFQRERS